jgi:hypothetical protein
MTERSHLTEVKEVLEVLERCGAMAERLQHHLIEHSLRDRYLSLLHRTARIVEDELDRLTSGADANWVKDRDGVLRHMPRVAEVLAEQRSTTEE